MSEMLAASPENPLKLRKTEHSGTRSSIQAILNYSVVAGEIGIAVPLHGGLKQSLPKSAPLGDTWRVPEVIFLDGCARLSVGHDRAMQSGDCLKYVNLNGFP